REAHRGGLALVELGVAPVVRVGRVEQLFVRALDHEDVLDVETVPELFPERDEALVEDQRLVPAVAGDEVQIVGMEAEIERVQDEAAARDPEVRLEVLMVVPAERRDAVAALEPEPLQRDRELLRAPSEVAE